MPSLHLAAFFAALFVPSLFVSVCWVTAEQPLTLRQRSARSATADYSSPSADSFLAANGLRTRHKPTQLFANTRLASPPLTSADIASVSDVNDLASYNLREEKRDICGQCTCGRSKNAFSTITCDYNHNRTLKEVFDATLQVPTNVTAIMIRLAPRTHFQLVRGFFNGNKVNSLTIEGSHSDGEQVEIAQEAFRGNNGPYPEIHIQNVFSVIVRENAFSGSVKFTVRNSNDLILYPNAFANAEINGLFVSINDLRIEEKAFNLAQAKLRIESSHIDNIYRFEASLREIRFVNCTIGTINGGTFDVISINSIVFENCRIDVIKARAITEKLYSNHVSISGAIIGSIEGEAIYGSGIKELILTKNKIDTIHENAIYVTAIDATIAHNNIKHLGHNWLHVKEWSKIIVEKNQFGDFGRIWLEDTKPPVTCRFDGNSLTLPQPGSLNITNPYCILRDISVNMQCRCNLDWLNKLSSHDLRSETYCTIDDKLKHCFNATSFNTLKYMIEVCDESKTSLDCVANRNLKKVDGKFFTPEELERRSQNRSKWYFVAGGGVVVVLLLLGVVLVACKFRRSSPKFGGGGDSTLAQTGGNSSFPHANKHEHEFSHSDRDTINQTLKVMQKKYPEIHNPVSEQVQIMLKSDLPDKKCVKAVTRIVNLMKDVPEEDFVAFNRVLTQHLQPPLPTVPPTDPIYTEPGQPASNDDGFYTSSTIMAISPEGYDGPHFAPSPTSAHSTAPEHIYAEPNCAKQPLLRNEYASPADRNTDAVDLYTEPISERDDAAYASGSIRSPQYAMPLRNLNTMKSAQPSILPSTISQFSCRIPPSQNLPDVLYQSQRQRDAKQITPALSSVQPLTNVKKLAKDLQSTAKFHPNQLASTGAARNMHLVAPPVYTAPDLTRKQQHQKSNSGAPARLASPEADECELDMRGATALPPDTGSDHSGGSNETVKIDDIIEYVDA